jgi:type II restriction enzyme
MAKIERLNKTELVEYCTNAGINPKEKTKQELMEAALNYENGEITKSINAGKGPDFLYSKIELLAEEYAKNLNTKIANRIEEMKADDNSHYLIYRVLGISNIEGQKIDEYQNSGRFLYKYAGSFLEEAASLCLKFKNVSGGKALVENSQSKTPKRFEIDFLDGKNAIEIKWKDATTDGDHITKEHLRVKSIESQSYIPIRIMFYYPHRQRSIKIQDTLRTLYKGVKGEYYAGEEAWDFIKNYTGYDLLDILIKISAKRESNAGN